jgi:signal transduction histidine kinase
MSVRLRVAAALALFAVPAMIVVAYSFWRARHDALVEAVYAATIERMEAGGRERCEADPETFALGPLHPAHHPLPGPGAGRPGRRGRHGRFRGDHVRAYDARFAPARASSPPLERDLRQALEDGETIAFRATGAHPVLAMRMPWSEGPCAVIVVEPHRGENALRGGSLGRDLALGLGALGFALIVALLALGPPLRRLTQLADSVRRAPVSDPSWVPTAALGGDEIGEIARALGEAGAKVREHVARLEARDRAMTEYVDATTHDLAIPLTVLKGRLADVEAAARTGAPVDRAVISGAMAECEYIAQLVANMAAVARLEGGHEKVEREPVDLAAIVDRVVARHRPIAVHHGIALDHATPDGPVIALGDDILLERAVSNLVHNAIRHHGGTEGHVAVVLERRDGRFRISVRGDGAAIDPALVERLARAEEVADPRRARGHGLGLRIVRHVARVHGLELAFRMHDDAGLEVELAGPLAPDAARADRITPSAR